MPFIVHVAEKSSLRVLGTRFNVKAYPDEQDMTTTLLEGKLRVEAAGGKQVVLLPGQQAVLNGSGLQQREAPNAETAVAWKNGLFNFDNKKLDAVMRELASGTIWRSFTKKACRISCSAGRWEGTSLCLTYCSACRMPTLSSG